MKRGETRAAPGGVRRFATASEGFLSSRRFDSIGMKWHSESESS